MIRNGDPIVLANGRRSAPRPTPEQFAATIAAFREFSKTTTSPQVDENSPGVRYDRAIEKLRAIGADV
jgi:hypothetical protein